MPSPFPGMDPFLEDPTLFPDLHSSFATYISEALQPRLPEPYFAVLSERLWVEASRRYIEPDVDVMEGSTDFVENGPLQSDGGGGVAVAVPATRTQPIVISVEDESFREHFVEIRARRGDDEIVVTTIEPLSLANKTPGSHGRDLYHRKQREVLSSGRIHLVEIDLLRGGEHATSLFREVLVRHGGEFDYHVLTHHFNKPWQFFLYPVRLTQSLPEIVIPLLPKDGGVALDLQAVFDRCYDSGPYRRRVRYDLARLERPLPPDQQEWAAAVLREKGPLKPRP